MLKIVIDTKGGDKGPSEMIKGSSLALEKFDKLNVVLVGDEKLIYEECKNLNMPMDRVEIVDAPGEITNYDTVADALFHKRDSSMLVSLKLMGENDDICGLLTTGNTGVLISSTIKYIPLETRVRPALSAILPSENGTLTCVVDTGATIDCTPDMLQHFAHLGSEFMKNMYAIENPKVGLLSNGSESSKGNKLVKETHQLLKDDKSINFIGNVEGNNALSGICDVVVCDGFAGNQVLKVTEGTAMRIIKDLMKYAKKTGSQEVLKAGYHLMSVYDIGSLGGGIILGVKKPVIKLRGNAGASAIVNTSQMLINLAENKAVFDKDKVKL